jgi:hypothetical protein
LLEGTVMPKPFQDAFEAWKKDNRYQVGEDIGWEYFDSLEASPTLVKRSSTLDENGDKNSAEKIIDSRSETV